MTRGLARVNRVLGKSPMKAKRAAIKQQDKVLGEAAKVMTGIEKTKKGLDSFALNPGLSVNQGIETAAKYPISVTSNIVGKATMVTNPTGIGLIPLGTIGTAGEIALRKHSPKYARITDRLAGKYHNAKKVKKVVGGAADTGIQILKNTFA